MLWEHAVSGTYDFVHHAAGLSILFPAWAKLAYHSAVDKFAEVAYQVLEMRHSIVQKEAALLGIERLENYLKIRNANTFQ